MSFFRSSAAFSSLTRRTATTSLRQPFTIRNLSSTTSRFAQGYGDGQGDPKAENPQDQGKSNTTKHDAEHPGPEPPSEGQQTGGGPTKGGQASPEDASAESGGSRSKEAKETGSSPTGGSIGKSGGKNKTKGQASPKISENLEPAAMNAEQQAEVDQHNKEFEERYDRAPPAENDKVDKKFWEGQGGADKQP